MTHSSQLFVPQKQLNFQRFISMAGYIELRAIKRYFDLNLNPQTNKAPGRYGQKFFFFSPFGEFKIFALYASCFYVAISERDFHVVGDKFAQFFLFCYLNNQCVVTFYSFFFTCFFLEDLRGQQLKFM